MKRFHVDRSNLSCGPAAFLESRTNASSDIRAISTQLVSPSSPLVLLLRQTTLIVAADASDSELWSTVTPFGVTTRMSLCRRYQHRSILPVARPCQRVRNADLRSFSTQRCE